MSMPKRPFVVRKTITGDFSGTQYVGAVEILPASVEGWLKTVQVRLDATDSNASSVTPFAVDGIDAEDLADEPADDFVVYEGLATALSASAVDADVNEDFDNPRPFKGGLKIGGEVIATGSFTLHVTARGDLGP